MREKSKATEDEVAQLMESYAASRTSWDKEVDEEPTCLLQMCPEMFLNLKSRLSPSKQRMTFLDRVKSEQDGRRAVTEAFGDLHQKHSELSLQAKSQAQHINELEVC